MDDTKNGMPIIDQMTDIAAEAAGNLVQTEVRERRQKKQSRKKAAKAITRAANKKKARRR